MNIADILRGKGENGAVVSIGPDEPVTALLRLLAEHGIGAALVVDASDGVGIVSERDVVRALDREGADVLARPVRDLMTTPVVSCGPDDPVDGIAETMTAQRFRHMPVLDDGRIVGVVSIGDVVKSRIRELEQVSDQLEQYVTG